MNHEPSQSTALLKSGFDLSDKITWTDWISDRFSPILVKEVRQSLKSRLFLITFMLVIGVCWLIALFGSISQGNRMEFGAVAPQFFYGFYLTLTAALYIVVPFLAYWSLLVERHESTYEMLSITTLSARSIVWGKLSGVLLQMMIFFFAVTPFIAFSSLLQGFTLASSLMMLVIAGIVSLLLSTLGFMLSTLTTNRMLQGVIALMFLAGLFLFYAGIGVQAITELIFFGGTIIDREFWIGMIVFVCISLSYVAVGQQIAVSMLTFESGNRSTGVRILLSLQLLAIWTLTFVMISNGWLPPEAANSILALSLIQWAIVGFFVCTEPRTMSRRVIKKLPNNLLLRFASLLYLPGSGRGLMYLIVHLAIIIGFGFLTVDITSYYPFFIGCVATALYIVIYSSIGSLLSGSLIGRVSGIRPIHVLLLLICICAVMWISPQVIDLFLNFSRNSVYQYSLLFIHSPAHTLIEIGNNNHNMLPIIAGLVIIAAVAVALNIPAFIAGISEVLRKKLPPRGLPVSTPTVAASNPN